MTPDRLAWFAGQLPVIGHERQQALLAAKMAVVGLGRIGTTVALALHAVGVGRLVLVDPQRVEDEQLGPMWFFRQDQIGTPKVHAVAELLKHRPYGQVEAVMTNAESAVTASRIRQSNVVLSCANTISARLATERNAIANGLPVIQAAALDGRERLGGIVTVHRPATPDNACYGCLVHDQDGVEAGGEGLLTTMTALVGTLAAHIATLMISDPDADLLDQNVFIIDGGSGTIEALVVMRRPGCENCGPTE